MNESTWQWRGRILASAAVPVVGALWLFVAVQQRSPYFHALRGPLVGLWIAAGLLACAWWIHGGRRERLRRRHGLAVALALGGLVSGQQQLQHWQHRRWVLNAPAAQLAPVGRHLVVGWLGLETTRALAAKGAIAGVFLTRRDFPPGAGVAEIRRVVDDLQAARTVAGWPKLWIATDQEGGPVAKLSPAVPVQPGLGTLLAEFDRPGLAQDPARAERIVACVRAYAEPQALALAAAGVNLNFAPVLDLKPERALGMLDRHTKISTRALGREPEVVALAGETYVRVLAAHGITAVLKHFPGLGRVGSDTHHFRAELTDSAADLEARDWRPFRTVASSTGAAVMLGHVVVGAVDAARPASCSAAVARGLLRECWGLRGLLVTDDFSMAPIFHGPGGLAEATRRSLAAGVDLILLSYDRDAVFDLLHELWND